MRILNVIMLSVIFELLPAMVTPSCRIMGEKSMSIFDCNNACNDKTTANCVVAHNLVLVLLCSKLNEEWPSA